MYQVKQDIYYYLLYLVIQSSVYVTFVHYIRRQVCACSKNLNDRFQLVNGIDLDAYWKMMHFKIDIKFIHNQIGTHLDFPGTESLIDMEF